MEDPPSTAVQQQHQQQQKQQPSMDILDELFGNCTEWQESDVTSRTSRVIKNEIDVCGVVVSGNNNSGNSVVTGAPTTSGQSAVQPPPPPAPPQQQQQQHQPTAVATTTCASTTTILPTSADLALDQTSTSSTCAAAVSVFSPSTQSQSTCHGEETASLVDDSEHETSSLVGVGAGGPGAKPLVGDFPADTTTPPPRRNSNNSIRGTHERNKNNNTMMNLRVPSRCVAQIAFDCVISLSLPSFFNVFNV